MRSRLPVALLLLLGACAQAGIAAGGAATGGFATFITVNADANTALKVVKPINEVLCVLRPIPPRSVEAKAAVDAFCAHLPDSTLGLLPQLLAVIEAVDAAHDAVAP